MSKRAQQKLTTTNSAIEGTATHSGSSPSELVAVPISRSEVKSSSGNSRGDTMSNQNGQNGLLDHIQKRIRNLQKRKQKLDKYAETAQTVEGRASLNADQLLALNNRESVEGPLKELADIASLYKEENIKREKQFEKEKAALIEQAKQDAQKMKQVGIDLGTEKLKLTVKFLRAASIMRQLTQYTPQDESLGLEKLLTALYAGEESSVECLDKLFEGVKEPVDVGLTTYARIKEISETPVERLYTMHQEPDKKDQENDPAPKKMPQISFLQEEDEDDENDDYEGQQDEKKTNNDSKENREDRTTQSISVDNFDDQQQQPHSTHASNDAVTNGHVGGNKNTQKDNRKFYRKKRNATKKKQEIS